MFATRFNGRARSVGVPRIAAAGITFLLLSTGCASGESSTDSSKTNGGASDARAAFAERMEATCADLHAQVDPVIGRLISSGTATRDEMRSALGTIVEATRDQLAGLRTLHPPADQRESFGEYVAAVERAATEIQNGIGVTEYDDVVGEGRPSPFFEAEARADGMGIHRSCGSGEASPDEPLTPQQRRDANHVEVVATEYRWAGIPRTVGSGPTALDFRNDGDELHELFLVQLADGTDPDAAIAAAITRLESGEPQTEQPADVVRRLGVARGGPHAIASPEVDLTPGTYMAICLLPDAEHISHARHGMATWFEATT